MCLGYVRAYDKDTYEILNTARKLDKIETFKTRDRDEIKICTKSVKTSDSKGNTQTCLEMISRPTHQDRKHNLGSSKSKHTTY